MLHRPPSSLARELKTPFPACIAITSHGRGIVNIDELLAIKYEIRFCNES